ncbi:MAG: hypothetical protein KGI30_00190 [Planctomycetota bacterium]|nr:hypothetical protein [Planctomycetota bacterium]
MMARSASNFSGGGKGARNCGQNFLDIANFVVIMRLQHVSSVELFNEENVGGGERRLFTVVDFIDNLVFLL